MNISSIKFMWKLSTFTYDRRLELIQIDSYGYDNYPPLSHFINYLKNTECEKALLNK